jgi:hypothetical protein
MSAGAKQRRQRLNQARRSQAAPGGKPCQLKVAYANRM